MRCNYCGKLLVKRDNEFPYLFKKRKYCNHKCSLDYKKGKHLPGTFKKGSKINVGRKRLDMTGKNNIKWTEKPGYEAIHAWVSRWKGKPNICEGCGNIVTNSRQIHWANIDHKYRRVLDDYIRLCAKCHKKYDKR